MVTRVGDLAQSNRMQSLVRQTQSRIADGQIAIATGKNAKSYAEIGDKAGLLIASQQQSQLTARFVTENQKVVDRTNMMSTALGGVADLAERFRSTLVAAMQESTGSAVPLESEVQNMLSEVTNLLNSKFEGRYLFSGSRTDTAPVTLPVPPPTGTDPSLYYQGDEQRLTARIDVGTEVTYGVTASNPALADLIGALGQVHEASATSNPDMLSQALDRVGSAIDGIATLRGSLGVTTARIEATVETQKSAQSYLDEVVDGIVGTDLASAYSKIASDTASLEASFLLTSKLSKLSLAEYL